jgi:hypothetical protein
LTCIVTLTCEGEGELSRWASAGPASDGLRYLGVIKNNAWLHTRAAALNLRTLINLGLTRTNGHWTIAPAPAN